MSGAEGSLALVAGAVGAEIVVTEDAGRVPVVETDLDGVVADLSSGIGARFGLVHGEEGGGRETRRDRGVLVAALIIAGGAGAIVAQIGEIKVTGVAVGPGDVDASTGFYVDFDGGGPLPLVDG